MLAVFVRKSQLAVRRRTICVADVDPRGRVIAYTTIRGCCKSMGYSRRSRPIYRILCFVSALRNLVAESYYRR